MKDTNHNPKMLNTLMHWASAFLVLGMILLGWSFDEQPRQNLPMLLLLHLFGGAVVLLLTTIRLGFNLRYHVYRIDDLSIKTKSRKIIQSGLYLALFVVPLTGLLVLTNSDGFIDLPYQSVMEDLLFPLHQLRFDYKEYLHKWLANTLVLLIICHILGAILTPIMERFFSHGGDQDE